MPNSYFFKFIFLFFLINFSFQANAQIEKGTISILPDVSLTIDRNNNTESIISQFSFFLRPSYYVLKNFAVNADIGYSSNPLNAVNSQVSDLTLGGGLTYVIPISENFYIPIFTGINYSASSFNDSGFDFLKRNKISNFMFGAGAEYLVADRLGLRFSIVNNFTKFFGGENMKVYALRGFFGVNLYFAKQS